MTTRLQKNVKQYFKDNIGIIGALLILCIFLSVFPKTSGSFLTQKNIFNVLRQISSNLFLACGMTMVIILGGIDLSVGSIIALSGCFAAGCVSRYGLPIAVGVLGGVLVGTVVGMFNGVVISKLAASLATLEKKVLVVDADPQANASSGLGVDIKQSECTIYECIIDRANVQDAIHDTEIDSLKVISSHINLVGAEIEMLNLPNREKILKEVLTPLKKEYDYILIDCSPSLGLITINALTAADSVIIPVQAEYFALEGISKLLNTIKIIKSKLNPALEIEGFLLTMYDSRLRQANQIYDEVKRHFQELVFNTVIQRNVKLSEAPSYGVPTILYDADSTGAKNHLALAKEIINRNK